MLDWDKPLSQQSPEVQAALAVLISKEISSQLSGQLYGYFLSGGRYDRARPDWQTMGFRGKSSPDQQNICELAKKASPASAT